MSRYSGMSRTARRAWGIGSILFFIIMCAMIAYGQQRADRNAYACEHGLPGCPFSSNATR